MLPSSCTMQYARHRKSMKSTKFSRLRWCSSRVGCGVRSGWREGGLPCLSDARSKMSRRRLSRVEIFVRCHRSRGRRCAVPGRSLLAGGYGILARGAWFSSICHKQQSPIPAQIDTSDRARVGSEVKRRNRRTVIRTVSIAMPAFRLQGPQTRARSCRAAGMTSTGALHSAASCARLSADLFQRKIHRPCTCSPHPAARRMMAVDAVR